MKVRIKNCRVPFLIITFFSFSSAILKGQDINNNLRTLDNNHNLASDTSDWRFFRSIKEIRLSGKNSSPHISFGGEIREQIRIYHNLNYGDTKPPNDIYLQQRYMLHFDLFINKNLRFFTQLNATDVSGKNNISLNDRENLDFSQAFLDIGFNTLSSRFRFGRQELCYGSERILGPRDGPNNRQTYDGAKYTLILEKLTGDFILVNPVMFQPGPFDNIRAKNYLILAGYWTLSLANKNIIDLYYFGTTRKYATEIAGNTTEKRHSMGVRIEKSSNRYFYDIEGTLQKGTYQNQHISGWHFTSIIGYQWRNLTMRPTIQIKGSVFSGNKDSTDNQINSFRPISAKPPVNEMLPVGPTNIILLIPEGEINITNNLGLTLKYSVIWRLRRTDGLYSTDMERMIRPPDKPGENNGNYVAGGPGFEMNYTGGKHFEISITTGYFIPGKYVKNTGNGKDLQALSLKAYYRF